ncbi:MAG: hypothetical protein HYV32_03760 [Candidatus Kerfeldbacteria bacterium]|nr:hypothetical protein [Candidatus Kerfeldbacteria bacterium]
MMESTVRKTKKGSTNQRGLESTPPRDNVLPFDEKSRGFRERRAQGEVADLNLSAQTIVAEELQHPTQEGWRGRFKKLWGAAVETARDSMAALFRGRTEQLESFAMQPEQPRAVTEAIQLLEIYKLNPFKPVEIFLAVQELNNPKLEEARRTMFDYMMAGAVREELMTELASSIPQTMKEATARLQKVAHISPKVKAVMKAAPQPESRPFYSYPNNNTAEQISAIAASRDPQNYPANSRSASVEKNGDTAPVVDHGEDDLDIGEAEGGLEAQASYPIHNNEEALVIIEDEQGEPEQHTAEQMQTVEPREGSQFETNDPAIENLFGVVAAEYARLFHRPAGASIDELFTPGAQEGIRRELRQQRADYRQMTDGELAHVGTEIDQFNIQAALLTSSGETRASRTERHQRIVRHLINQAAYQQELRDRPQRFEPIRTAEKYEDQYALIDEIHSDIVQVKKLLTEVALRADSQTEPDMRIIDQFQGKKNLTREQRKQLRAAKERIAPKRERYTKEAEQQQSYKELQRRLAEAQRPMRALSAEQVRQFKSEAWDVRKDLEDDVDIAA